MPQKQIFVRVDRWEEAVCLAPPSMLKAIDEMRRQDTQVVFCLFLADDSIQMPCTTDAIRSGIQVAEDAARALYSMKRTV